MGERNRRQKASGDPRKRDARIVSIGKGTTLSDVEQACYYRKMDGAVVPILRKDNCPVCGKALTVYCEGGVFADFFTVHTNCARRHYERYGCPPKGFGMAFVGEGTDQMVIVGRVEQMHEMMKNTPPEQLGWVKHSFR